MKVNLNGQVIYVKKEVKHKSFRELLVKAYFVKICPFKTSVAIFVNLTSFKMGNDNRFLIDNSVSPK